MSDQPAAASDVELDVSIVLPVYNEKGHLHEEIRRVRTSMDRSSYSYEIILVDDGSDDGSSEALRDIDGIRLIQFEHNRGSGSARKAGTLAARGRIVVWTDVDMTYPNDQIPELVDSLAGHDQVVGARTTEEGTHKALRVPAKWLIRQLASYLSRTPIPDLNSGFRAFRREVALPFLRFLPTGFSCVTTITMSFLANGYSVRYIDIPYAERAGSSKFHWMVDTRRYIIQVLRMILMFNPLRVFLPLGLGIGAIASGKLFYDLFGADFRVAGNTQLLFFAAFQLVAIGVLADLIGQSTRPISLPMPARSAATTGHFSSGLSTEMLETERPFDHRETSGPRDRSIPAQVARTEDP